MRLKDGAADRNGPLGPGQRLDVGTHPAMRPKDAASLILIHRERAGFRVLMGKRAGRHAFMPNTYVFPGGRRDRADSFAPITGDLDAGVVDKLMQRVAPATSPVRARALAVAALRETREETGLVIGRDDADTGGYDLSALRYVARAVTPPGRNRRYDTRFFASFTDEAGIATDGIADSSELSDLRWVPMDALPDLPLPAITATILGHVRDELSSDPALGHGRAVPLFHTRRGVFLREFL